MDHDNYGGHKTVSKKWSEEEIEKLKNMREKGHDYDSIAAHLGRSRVSVKLKYKRLQKRNGSYNFDHIDEKYDMNQQFLNFVKPNSLLDLYSGDKSFYDGKVKKLVTNDKLKTADSTYHKDALACICDLYSENKKFDIIDLDPFGSAYDCIDLAVKMANKGLVITLGELGHKRWKRLDFVSSHYGICSMEDFTMQNMIEHIQMIGRRNKKDLIVWGSKEWKNIGRVYFTISPIKITSQWEGKA